MKLSKISENEQYVTESHHIDYSDVLYPFCLDICLKSVDVYNKTLYILRGLHTKGLPFPSFFDLIPMVRSQAPDIYNAFTSVDIATCTIKKAHDNYMSFFAALKDYNNNPHKYKSRPRIPNFKENNDRIFIAICPINAISEKNFIKNNLIGLSDKSHLRTKFNADITYDDIKNFSVVPLNGVKGTFKLILTYKQKKQNINLNLNKENCIAIDTGVANTFTIASNIQNFNPILVKGGELKRINQDYNKNIANYNSKLIPNIITKRYDLDYDKVRHTSCGTSGTSSYLEISRSTSGQVIRDVHTNVDINDYIDKKNFFLIKTDEKGNYTETIRIEKPYSKRMNRINVNRSNKMNDIGYKLANNITELCIKYDIGTIIIGKNDRWKQNVNLGDKTNQNFTYIPLAKFIDKIKYVASKYGIDVIINEESYTSKCSFLDLEPICEHDVYKGERKTRDWFTSSDGRITNADVNAAYNIMQKVKSDIFTKEARTNCIMVNNASGKVEVTRLNPYSIRITDIIRGKKITDIV